MEPNLLKHLQLAESGFVVVEFVVNTKSAASFSISLYHCNLRRGLNVVFE